MGLATIFYCLRFKTSLFVASYDKQGHGGGIRPRLHMCYFTSCTAEQSRVEQGRTVTYCRNPSSTVTPGIEPRWDPWPCIFQCQDLWFFSYFVVPPLIKRKGLDFYNWYSLTTPYSIKLWCMCILSIIHRTQTDTMFYYTQGHLSLRVSEAAGASTYLELRNGS
jgi:hypothetical protein